MTANRRADGHAAESGGTIAISALGPFAFTRAGGEVRLPKKAQALLTFLLMARGRAFPREQLATLLWGDSATEQARRSLRQCLVVLRAALGPDAERILVADNDTVHLDAQQIVFDAAQFAALAAGEGDARSAAALYRDELLAGLHIEGEAFNQWLSIERERFASMRLDLLLRLANAHADNGDLEGAITFARQFVALDPLREDGHRTLMRLLARAGQRNAALQHFTECATLLRQELGVAPDAETLRLAEALRTETGAVPLKPEAAPPSADAGPPPPDNPSIAVLPFLNLSGDVARDYFVCGLVEDITVALGCVPWLFVVASPSAFAAADLREIGTRLGVRYVLRGSLRIAGEQVLAVVQLNDVAYGRIVWSARLQDEIDNVFALQERLTTKVAATLAPALMSVEVERARHKPTESLTAFDLYLQALPRFRASLPENREALALLRRAIAADPSYGAAYAMASRCYLFQKMLDWLPPRDTAFAEGVRFGHLAAQHGRNDPEALWMAGISLAHLSGEIEHALELIDRSLSLNPNSANAWSASCQVRSYLGDAATALEHFERAQRLNPLDLSQHVHWNMVAWAYIAAERYDDALDAAGRTLRVQPDYLPGLRLSTCICGMAGRIDEGRFHLKRLLAVQPGCTIRWLQDFFEAPLGRNPELLNRYLSAMRAVGLPE